jgi:hypothetical protein
VIDYGAANRFGFDDPSKWYTQPSVPLLDEHVMTNEDGSPVATVDRAALEEIAANNNKRVHETGDPATLILGHTSDDPRAPEKPAVGFITNYRVKPFKRDPKTGQVIYAIHGDYKIRHDKKHLLEEYPRRSVELWWNKKELDPVAMLGGSSPERDLGVVIRNARMNHVSMDATPKNAVRGNSPNDSQEVIRFSTRGKYTIETYSIEQPRRYAKLPEETPEQEWEKEGYDEDQYGPEDRERIQSAENERNRVSADRMKEIQRKKDQAAADADAVKGLQGRRKPPPFSSGGNMGPTKYDGAEFGQDDLDTYDGGDEAVPTDGMDDMGGGDDDPVLAKVFQSKQWKDLSSKIDMIAQAITGGAGGGMGEPGMGGEEMPPEMPPPGGGMDQGMGGQAPPPGAEAMGDEGGEGDGMEPEEDERRMHGSAPVQMSADSTGYCGPSDTYVPGYSGKSRMSRNGTQHMNGTKRRVNTGNPEVIKLQRQMSMLQRQNKELRMKYARSDAATIVRDLEAENIRFGRTDEEHKVGMAEEAQYIATMLMDEQGNGEKDVEAYVNDVIRKKFARSRPNPAAPVMPGVARFARQSAGAAKPETDETDDAFEDTHLQDFQKISELAEMQSRYERQGQDKATARKAAIKYMRKKYSL